MGLPEELAALKAEVARLRVPAPLTLTPELLDYIRRHGPEHGVNARDPTRNRVQVASGVPTHRAVEGTVYWNTATNDLYVNNDGGSGWSNIGGGTTSHSQDHNILATADHDADGSTAVRGDLLRRGATLWEGERALERQMRRIENAANAKREADTTNS